MPLPPSPSPTKFWSVLYAKKSHVKIGVPGQRHVEPHIITVKKQSMWHPSFVYSSQISLPLQTALNFGKQTVTLQFYNSKSDTYEPRQANLCLRAFRHDKFQLCMSSHSEGPGIWFFTVWRFLLIHCLYERAAKVLASLRLAWTFAARIGDKYQIRLMRPICNEKFVSLALFTFSWSFLII